MLGSVVPGPPATGTAAAAAGMQRGWPLGCLSCTENKTTLRYHFHHLGQLFQLQINGINVMLHEKALLALQQQLLRNNQPRHLNTICVVMPSKKSSAPPTCS
jgi:hypothetical protein